MSDMALKMLSGTGTHRVLEMPQAEKPKAESGKESADAGKRLPEEKEQPDLVQVAEQLNSNRQAFGGDLSFEVNMDSGHSMIQVLDRETGEVIRQIPPEKVQPVIRENGSLEIRLYDEVV